MTICWWVFGIRRSSIRLWKAEHLLYRNLPTTILKLDIDGNQIILKTRGIYMTMLVKMHFIRCPTISICQVVLKLRPKTNSLRQKTRLLWIYEMRRSFQMLLWHVFLILILLVHRKVFLSCKSWTYSGQSYGLYSFSPNYTSSCCKTRCLKVGLLL